MSCCNGDSSEIPPSSKRQKLDDTDISTAQNHESAQPASGIVSESELHAEEGLPPLQEFSVDKVLFSNAKTKSVAIVGTFSSNPGLNAVVLAEKQPLTDSDLGFVFSSTTSLSKSFQNDVYAQYIASCSNGVGTVKLQTVYPATDAHVQKYSARASHLILESPEDYRNITLPFIEKEVIGLEWVFNILEGKAEADRVVYSDPDPVDGFVLIPDMKWDQSDTESLYLLGIVHQRGLTSIRDLRTEHLPLLRNILIAGKKAITERYGLPADQIRAYFHYPPSNYHLHVHFTHLSYDAPKTAIGQSHLLEDVIDNIENVSGTYYFQRTIACILREGTPLWEHFNQSREQASSSN